MSCKVYFMQCDISSLAIYETSTRFIEYKIINYMYLHKIIIVILT